MTKPETLEYRLERAIVIRAPRDLVFRYFTDSVRFAAWWGDGSSVDARPGGAVRIVYPGGTVAVGEVLEIVPGERFVFSFGFETGTPIAPGGSRVDLTLEAHPDGTRLRLTHVFVDRAMRDGFVQGWRYQLSVFANIVSAEAHGAAVARADRWFAAWNETDPAARRQAFEACAVPDVTFADAYGCTHGIEDLDAHVTATKVHMPGLAIARAGEARQCQGAALVPWAVTDASGAQQGGGTNLFEFAADGRIARVVGFWGG